MYCRGKGKVHFSVEEPDELDNIIETGGTHTAVLQVCLEFQVMQPLVLFVNLYFSEVKRNFAMQYVIYNVLWDAVSNVFQKEVLFLFVWFRASLIYINNCPTRCNPKQSIYYSACSLYMFRVSTTPIIRSSQNCNYSLRYWSYFSCSYLPPT